MPGAKKPFKFPNEQPMKRESIDPTPVPSTQPAPTPAPRAPAPAGQPTPKPTPPMNVQWKCELHGLETDGKTAGELPEKITVGTKLLATCDGPTASLKSDVLKIELNDQQTYSLHLISVLEMSETKASLIVTPWKAGELKMTNPALTDAVTRVGMGDLELNVASVINPKENPEGKPFPPMHPLTLAWPLWLWLFVAAIALGFAGQSSQ
jgi:hypothetical protein